MLILILALIFISGCAPIQGDGACLSACRERNYTEGSCYKLGVRLDPCEAQFNYKTIYSQDGYCKPIETTGISNACCCRK
jgi:hypothetical protein